METLHTDGWKFIEETIMYYRGKCIKDACTEDEVLTVRKGQGGIAVIDKILGKIDMLKMREGDGEDV